MSTPQVERLTREDVIRVASDFHWTKKMAKWTVIVDGREFPARPLVLAAAGVAPNDATNSHMAIAKLKALGFETRYAGQEHSGPAPELVTTFEGKELAHRECWEVVLEQQTLADSRERGWYRPSLVAMVFAFHAVEAYLNFVGELLAPDIWKNERDYFKKLPYRGFSGKLRKVMELVGHTADENARPLKTVLELKRLRDLIAHGRSERFEGSITHGSDEEPGYPLSTLRSQVLPRHRLALIVADVEVFLNSLQALAGAKLRAEGMNDPWFGREALRGPSWYASRNTTLAAVDD
jgi:hypothetical protein